VKVERILVGLFVIILLVAFCHEARSQVSIEAGPTILSGEPAEGGALILSERFNDRWEVQVGYLSEQYVDTCGRPDCQFDIRENIFLGGQRVVGWERFKLGIGMAAFQNINRALGCRVNFNLLIEWRWSAHVVSRIRHFSSAGSCTPNMGQDMVTLGWRFR